MSRTVEMTVSGIDGGGFAWQNVFHLQTDDDATALEVMLHAALDEVNTNLIPSLQAAMSSVYKILDIGAKLIDPSTSFTLHKNINVAGTRASSAAVGALCAMISFYPAAGTHIGRMFLPGCLQGDWALDIIGGTYAGLVATVKDAYLSWQGAVATYHWQFGLWNKATPAFLPLRSGAVNQKPTTLNKRMRA